MPRVTSGSSFGLLCVFVLGSSLLSLTGCGMGTTAAPDPVPLTVSGRVHGGQQPVAGANIQLYVTGDPSTSNTSVPLLNTTVNSGPDGSFTITSDYSCPSATAQVYLVATQGNPGLGSGGNNPALAMMAPLGSCGNVSSAQFISINEVTTVAAAWTLAPFTQDITHIATSSTNSRGLANAFLNSQLIVDTSTGNTPTTLPSNLTTETGKIYALADAVASCINSDGTTGCAPLFSAATPVNGSAPTNTWDALINIVKNPGNNVAGVFSAIGPQPPFPTTLAQAPNDWTLSLTVTGGGVASPESLAVDSQGNVWVADFNGLLSAFNPQGTPISSAGFGSGLLSEDFGLTIDPSDNIWVTIEEQPSHNSTRGSVVRFSGVSSGGTLGTSTLFSDNSINFPYAVAADSNGSIFIANYSVTGSTTNLVTLNPATSAYTPVSTGGQIGFPVALAADTAHGVWITGTSGGGASIAHVDASGNIIFSSDCCGPVGGVALDSSGDVWLTDSQDSDAAGDSGGAVTEFDPNGNTLHAFVTAGGITNPSHVAVDAAQNVWITNLHTNNPGPNESISEVAGSNSNSPGSAISPGTGFGRDAGLLLPYSLAIDPSGNLWVSNTGGNSLVMFFGLAAPTKTPLPVTPQAP